MSITYGFESMGTPNGDRASLERIAAEVNKREKNLWEQREKERKAKLAANNAAK